MRVLVTGGCGFLGQAFVERAGAAGADVLTLDRSNDADLVCDIGDPAAVADALRHATPEIVVHLAAALTDAAAADTVEATRINALGTAALFARCVAEGVGRVVYASSVAAVGPCPDGSLDDVALAPRSIYGATKAFGEHLARALSGTGATAFVVLRYGWIYGTGRVRGWRVAQDMIERFARGDNPVPYPDAGEVMDWTHVADAAEVLLRAVSCPVGPFVACNAVGDRRPIGDAAAHLMRRFPGSVAVPYPVAAPPSGWGLRNDGIEPLLGFAPRIRLEEGIDRVLHDLASRQ